MWPRGLYHLNSAKDEATDAATRTSNIITRSEFLSGLKSLLGVTIDWAVFDNLFRM